MEALFQSAGLRKLEKSHPRYSSGPEARELVLPEGTIFFTGEEISVFVRIFIVLDSDESGEIQVDQGTTFLRRSRLDLEVLREIWRWASGGTSKPRLGVGEWFVALKLVSLAQRRSRVREDRQLAGNDIDTRPIIESRDALFQGLADLPLPDFFFIPQDHGGIDLTVDASPTLPAEVCKVEVINPIVLGSGLSKFVQYTVRSRTSVDYLYNNQRMEVQRRYSDFVWLYDRLKRSYPATAIPPLPTKKVIGNFDPKFIDERRHGLEQFLMHLIRHPKLGRVFDLQVILDATANGLSEYRVLTMRAESNGSNSIEKKAENAAKAAKSAVQSRASAATSWLFPEANGDSSSGTNNGDASAISYNKSHQEAQFEEAKRRLQRWNSKLSMYEVALRELARALDRVVSCSAKEAKELSRLSEHFMRLASLEANHIRGMQRAAVGMQKQSATNGNSARPLDSPQSANYIPTDETELNSKVFEQYQYIDKSGSQLAMVASSKEDAASFHGRELLSPLKFMVSQVKAMRKVLVTYKSKVLDLRRAHDDRVTSQKQYDSSLAGAAFADRNKVEKAERRVAQSQEKIERIGLEVKEMASSIELEVEKFERDRLEELQRIAVGFVKAKIREAEEQTELFRNLAKSTCVDANEHRYGGNNTIEDVPSFRMKEYYKRRMSSQLSMTQKFKAALEIRTGLPLQPSFDRNGSTSPMNHEHTLV